MSYKQYPKTNGVNGERGFTEEEIRRGEQWLYTDVVCDSCGKSHFCSEVGKPCKNCGEELKG